MTAAAASQRSVFDAPLLGCRREAGPKLYIPIDARKKMERLADDKPQRAASALKGTMTVPPHHLLLATGSPKASQSRRTAAAAARSGSMHDVAGQARRCDTRRGGNNEGRNLRFGVRASFCWERR